MKLNGFLKRRKTSLFNPKATVEDVIDFVLWIKYFGVPHRERLQKACLMTNRLDPCHNIQKKITKMLYVALLLTSQE
ncbi:hypothetical protein GCM10011368_00130 [Hyunsoonleella pacifica]|nr:hypothetical protein GCM10011368_00130 [Hyunsoonleella pacifica]